MQGSTHRFGELVFANYVSMVTVRRADVSRSGALGQENFFPPKFTKTEELKSVVVNIKLKAPLEVL